MIVYLWSFCVLEYKILKGVQKWNQVGYLLLFQKHLAEARILDPKLPIVRNSGPEAWEWSD